jgi:hypothetical protein
LREMYKQMEGAQPDRLMDRFGMTDMKAEFEETPVY